MKAAIVVAPGKPPVYGDFREPTPKAGEVQIDVTAAALTPLTKGRASGTHYSTSAQFPAVVGFDGVGRLRDGRRVFFLQPETPFGAMAEKVVVPAGQLTPIPDRVDDVTAAAIANPGMSSWAALKERARLAPGETVLINGATGTSGRLAVQVAKYLGAKRVVATGRNESVLARLKTLGADATIPLTQSAEELSAAFQRQFAEGVDIVLDYLWGPSAEALLTSIGKAAKVAVPIRFVQIGSSSGADIKMPAGVLRSSALELTGSGLGSIRLETLVKAIAGVMEAVIPGKFHIETEAVPLADVEKTWSKDSGGRRIVFLVSPV